MTKAEINRTRILEDPIGKTLMRLAVPMIFGILSMVVYNLADTFFVGRLGNEQLAALSFTFPVVMFVGSIALGIGMGTSAVVSRAVGKQDYQAVHRLVFDSLLLGLVVVGILVAVGLSTIRPLFTLLGAEGIILDYIVEYMQTWYIGMVFVVVPMVGNNIIRATGDSKTPGMVMVLGAATNFTLDPLLIYGIGPFPELGIQGAALATVIGRSLTFFIALFVLIFREKLLKLTIPRLSELWASWKRILYIAVPNALTKMIVPLGAGFITRVISSYGPEAVAGYGIATRVEFFALASLNALSSVMGPFIGQNLGAGKTERVGESFTVSRHFSLAVGGGVFILLLLLADRVAGFFNTDPAIISVAALYMRVVSVAYAAQGFYMVASAGLNVMNRPLHAASLSLIEMFVLSVPLALLGSRLFGTVGVFSALSVSYLTTGILAYLVVRRVLAQARS